MKRSFDSSEPGLSRHTENTSFTCARCGTAVPPLTNGSYRNHCPHCLYSVHVDVVPGDRDETCGGLMEPVALRQKAGKGLQVVHRCRRCGALRPNRVAVDTVAPDDVEVLARLSALPLTEKG